MQKCINTYNKLHQSKYNMLFLGLLWSFSYESASSLLFNNYNICVNVRIQFIIKVFYLYFCE